MKDKSHIQITDRLSLVNNETCGLSLSLWHGFHCDSDSHDVKVICETNENITFVFHYHSLAKKINVHYSRETAQWIYCNIQVPSADKRQKYVIVHTSPQQIQTRPDKKKREKRTVGETVS